MPVIEVGVRPASLTESLTAWDALELTSDSRTAGTSGAVLLDALTSKTFSTSVPWRDSASGERNLPASRAPNISYTPSFDGPERQRSTETAGAGS